MHHRARAGRRASEAATIELLVAQSGMRSGLIHRKAAPGEAAFAKNRQQVTNPAAPIDCGLRSQSVAQSGEIADSVERGHVSAAAAGSFRRVSVRPDQSDGVNPVAVKRQQMAFVLEQYDAF